MAVRATAQGVCSGARCSLIIVVPKESAESIAISGLYIFVCIYTKVVSLWVKVFINYIAQKGAAESFALQGCTFSMHLYPGLALWVMERFMP